jgi:hypothetical protein
MITTAADSSPKNPDFEFRMVFFLKKARIKSSDLRQMYNSLRFVSSPHAEEAKALLARPSLDGPDAFLYLSLTLDKNLSIAISKDPRTGGPRGTDDFVRARQKAMAAILADDPDTGGRFYRRIALISASS